MLWICSVFKETAKLSLQWPYPFAFPAAMNERSCCSTCSTSFSAFGGAQPTSQQLDSHTWLMDTILHSNVLNTSILRESSTGMLLCFKATCLYSERGATVTFNLFSLHKSIPSPTGFDGSLFIVPQKFKFQLLNYMSINKLFKPLWVSVSPSELLLSLVH